MLANGARHDVGGVAGQALYELSHRLGQDVGVQILVVFLALAALILLTGASLATALINWGAVTLGADKAYDTRDFVSTLRELGVTPHVARRQNGAIDERTSRHPGYAISLSKRWLVEKPFGWLKQIGPLRKVKLRGLAKVDWLFVFSCAAFNLIRIPKLRAQSA